LDVAQAAGVSRATVSVVLNNLPGINISEATRQRVLDAAKSLDYSPNSAGRKLASGKSNTIGLVLGQSPEQVFADAFLTKVMFGIEQAAIKHGYHVLLKQVDPEDPVGYRHLVTENHVDGIILSGPRQDDPELVRLIQEGVPIILLGQMPESSIPFVDIDATKSAERAVAHLAQLGHRRIALITNARLRYTSAQQRKAGYESGLQKAGLRLNDALIKEGNYTPESGMTAMNELLNLPAPPTAVFVASDVVALGAMLAVKKAGLRIPEDIAFVGFDDIPLAEYFDPPLTTVRLPAFKLGWMACERLIHLLNWGALDQPGFLFETDLIVRSSSIVSRA
jgi:LacI family transcriptional regulator